MVSTTEKITAYFNLPTKLILIPGFTSSIYVSYGSKVILESQASSDTRVSNADRFNLSIPDEVVKNNSRHKDGGEQARDYAYAQGNGESLDGSCTEPKEEQRSNQSINIRIKDSHEGLGISRFNGCPRSLACTNLFTNPLKYKNVGIY